MRCVVKDENQKRKRRVISYRVLETVYELKNDDDSYDEGYCTNEKRGRGGSKEGKKERESNRNKNPISTILISLSHFLFFFFSFFFLAISVPFRSFLLFTVFCFACFALFDGSCGCCILSKPRTWPRPTLDCGRRWCERTTTSPPIPICCGQ